MLTEETQKILSNLFISIAKGENNVKITRQALSSSFDFSSFNIFFYLSNPKYQKITPLDIYNYLNSKNISISKLESQLIILFYDKNLDNALNFEEFYNLIDNDKLINNKSTLEFQKVSSIGSNIEYLLLKLFEKEIELAKNVIIYLKKLRIRTDFNIHKIFHYITKFNYINKFYIEKFLEKNNIDFIESDIKNIIRRLDINKDGVIDLRELYALIEFPDSCNNYYKFIPCDICKEKQCDNCFSINNLSLNLNIPKNNQEDNNKEISSPNNSRYNYILHSIDCTSSNKKNDIITQSLPQLEIHPNYENTDYNTNTLKKINNNIFEDKNRNKNKTFNIINNLRNKISFLQEKKNIEENPNYKIYPQNYLNPNIKSYNNNFMNSYYNSNINYYDIEKFNNFLRLIMFKEEEIENEKINFMNNTNLNFEDVFDFFDADKKGYISPQDLKNGFDVMEINQYGDEVELFMNRYDLLKNNKLIKLDFFDSIIPFDKEYRIIMENRSSSKEDKYQNAQNDNILNNKKNFFYLKKLFISIIDKENEINKVKKKFYNLEGKLKIVFKLIDNNNKGYFTFFDLNSYLEDNKLIFDNYAAALLFIRLDKKREGKIEMSEIMEEVLHYD